MLQDAVFARARDWPAREPGNRGHARDARPRRRRFARARDVSLPVTTRATRVQYTTRGRPAPRGGSPGRGC